MPEGRGPAGTVFMPANTTTIQSGGGTVFMPVPGAKKKGRHGVLGLAENLGTDIVHAVAGLPAGLVKTAQHPIGAAKAIGKSYAETYGPLAHGDLGKFMHNLYEHPLGPALDLLTLASGGAALGAKAGVLSEAARAVELRSPAVLAGQEGKVISKPIVGGQLQRAAKTRLHHALNRLPADMGTLGETVRFAKEIDRLPRRKALAARTAMRDYNKAVTNLSNEEFAALHLILRGVHPADWAGWLEKQDGHVEPATLRVLGNPRIVQGFEHPDAKILKAVDAAVRLGETDAALKIERGLLTPEAAQARVEKHARSVYGDRTLPYEPKGYVPDVISADRVPNSSFGKMGGGKGVAKLPDSLKQNKGVLFRTGRLALHPDLLGPEYLKTIKYGLFDDIHSELMGSAVKVSRGQLQSFLAGHQEYELLRKKIVSAAGNPQSQKIHALVSKAGDMQRSLDELAPSLDNAMAEGFTTARTDLAETVHGDYLVVPKELNRHLAGEFTRGNRTIDLILGKPTRVWRALVLGLRVGFLTNNIVGNHLLYAIRAAGPDGLRAYLNAVKRVHGDGMVKSLIQGKGIPPALRQQFMDEFFPEQVHGTFGATQKPAEGARLQGRKGRKVRSAALGVGPATQAAAEGNLRRALVEATIRKSPEFKRFYRAMPRQTRDFEIAAKEILGGDTGAEFQARVSREVNDALGDYLNLGPTAVMLRGFIPFVSWYKAILRITGHMAVDTPGRTDILSKIGEMGSEDTLSKLGPIPDYLLNVLPVGHKNGAQKVLGTGGLNAFQTVTQLGAGAKGVLAGQPGDVGKAFAQLGPSPFVVAAIQSLTGKELFTGRDIKGGPPGLPAQVYGPVGQQLPQVALAKALAGHGRESKLYGKQTGIEALLQFLGVPVKTLHEDQINRP